MSDATTPDEAPLSFAMSINYDQGRLESGFITEARRVLTVHVTGWVGMSEVEMLDAIDDIVTELPEVAARSREERLKGIALKDQAQDYVRDPGGEMKG